MSDPLTDTVDSNTNTPDVSDATDAEALAWLNAFIKNGAVSDKLTPDLCATLATAKRARDRLKREMEERRKTERQINKREGNAP